MPTTYAAYSNLASGNISMPVSAEQTPKATPRASIDSTSSGVGEVKKSRWHRFLDELKPIEVPQEPVGFFTPIQPYPRKEKKVKDENSKSRRASKAYEHFKVVVGGPRVGDL